MRQIPPPHSQHVSGCLGAGYFNYCDIDPSFAKLDHKVTFFAFIFHEKVVHYWNALSALVGAV